MAWLTWSTLILRWGVLLAALVNSRLACAAPPEVVEVTPHNGQVEVDPTLEQIRVVFDQPMARGGFSIVGGGATFPEVMGKGRWVNNHTFVMPIRLQPAHGYWFSVNSDRFANFRNLAGESAVPHPVQFWTAGDEAGALTAEANDAAISELERLLLTQYSHRDKLGIDWSARVATYRERLLAAESPMAFAQLLTRLLASAKDKHLSVRVGETSMGTHRGSVTANVNPQQLDREVRGLVKHSDTVWSGRLSGDVAYLAIHSWSKEREPDLAAAHAALERFQDAPGLVLDVRLNGGGDELLARRIAARFVSRPVLYAKHVTVTEGGGFSEPRERWLQPSGHAAPLQLPVAVLMGQVCMSSNEAFLLMMRQVPGAALIGARSQGSSGNPRRHELGNGVTVVLPSWIAQTAKGEAFEGKGLAPDIQVLATMEDLEAGDPVLWAALAWLQDQP